MNAGCSLILLTWLACLAAPSVTQAKPDPDGTSSFKNRAHFDRFSRVDGSPGAPGLREVKFVIMDVDTPTGTLHLINTSRYDYHYDFVIDALNKNFSLKRFNQLAYFRQTRSILAGTILAYDDTRIDAKTKGVYTIEFWPSDPVNLPLVKAAFSLVSKALPFTQGKLFYHPVGETQDQLYAFDKQRFADTGIPVISTTTLLGDRRFSAHNTGTSFGRLRIMENAPTHTPSITDIVVYKHPPNDLSHVAGIITDTPQAPLSHINLKAKQNNTPNAYVSKASTRPELLKLDGQYVRFRVTEQGYTLTPSTQEAVARFHVNTRPKTPFTPPLDLSQTELKTLASLRHRHLNSFGAKAANLGELRHLLRDSTLTPNGYAIPFSFYHQFMTENHLYDLVKEQRSDPRFRSDPAWRQKQLKALRKIIKKTPVSLELSLKIQDLHRKFTPGTSIRCRSSTNTEDLKEFNGAGLYDSYTHHPDEGKLEKSIKQVWASLWNYRAYEEREYYRIDHFKTAMGVLVHPNYSGELANGVALTKNPFYQYVPGFYINVQAGESLVTNPELGALPDEVLIMQVSGETHPMGITYETIYIRQSTLTKDHTHVMTPEQLTELRFLLQKIQTHFAKLYNAPDDVPFGVDIEFKLSKDNKLVIKQARPWVE